MATEHAVGGTDTWRFSKPGRPRSAFHAPAFFWSFLVLFGLVRSAGAIDALPCANTVPAGWGPECHCPNEVDANGRQTCACPTNEFECTGEAGPGTCPKCTAEAASGLCTGKRCTAGAVGRTCSRDAECACALPDQASFCPGNCWFSIVVLPDTQRFTRYNGRAPVIFDCQTEWIKANRDRLKIAFVLHVGDVVNNDTVKQWAKAKSSMCVLDPAFNSAGCIRPGVPSPCCTGRKTGCGVPYLIALGNMDNVPFANAHNYFPLSVECPTPGVDCNSYDGTIDYAYRVFNVCNADWMPVASAWTDFLHKQGPGSALEWLDHVANDNPTRRIPFVTHSFLDDTGRLTDKGVDVWTRYASKHRNIPLIFSGHDKADARHPGFPVSRYVEHQKVDDGRPGPGTLVDGQAPVWAIFSAFHVPIDNRRTGALEVVNVCPNLGKVRVTLYSPWWNDCYADLYQFQYDLPDDGSDRIDFSLACGDGVVGGTEQCDDGNTVGADCCSATCRLEPHCR